jgi:integrase
MSRGDGRIWKVGPMLHCALSVDGVEVRWSSGVRWSSETYADDEAKARKQLEKACAQKEAGLFIGPKEQRLKFEDMAADLANYYRTKGKTASLESLPYFLKPLRTVFGMNRARSIKADRIRKYTADRLDEGAKPATINKELGVLQRMFSLALEDERLSKASVPAIKRLTENNTRTGFVEPGDFARLRKALPDYLQDPVSFLYASSWRVGEMRSLEWRDVDRDLSAVRLRAEVSKNRHARTLILRGELLEIMRRAARARRLGCPYVFHHDGQQIGDFRKAWAHACKTADLAGVLIHDLRRSGIRNAVRAGVSEKVAMTMSGHRTRNVFDRYNISSEADLADAAQKITAYVQGGAS